MDATCDETAAAMEVEVGLPFDWAYAAEAARVEPTNIAEGLGVGQLFLAAVDPALSPEWLLGVGVLRSKKIARFLLSG